MPSRLKRNRVDVTISISYPPRAIAHGAGDSRAQESSSIGIKFIHAVRAISSRPQINVITRRGVITIRSRRPRSGYDLGIVTDGPVCFAVETGDVRTKVSAYIRSAACGMLRYAAVCAAVISPGRA
ncbi:unnamed protein product, partial [Iphiclides podalirius]